MLMLVICSCCHKPLQRPPGVASIRCVFCQAITRIADPRSGPPAPPPSYLPTTSSSYNGYNNYYPPPPPQPQSGCINDAKCLKYMLINRFNFPDSSILMLTAQLPGTTQDHLQIFNIEAKAKLKSHQMPEQVVFWKWINPKMLGIATQSSVYHWSIEGDSEPVKMFDRAANLANNQIINYKCDPSEKWLVLIGIAPGSAERPQLVKGNMQLFSVDQQRSDALEAHAASFASFRVPGNYKDSILISFVTKASNAGQTTSKLHVIELGAQPGNPSFTAKQGDLFFPPDFADDFPVAMEISHKYHLIYVITKHGLLFVYDLATAKALYRNRISPDPIFLTSEASSNGGF